MADETDASVLFRCIFTDSHVLFVERRVELEVHILTSEVFHEF